MVQCVPLFESLIQSQLANLASHCGLGQIRDCLVDVLDVVRGFVRIRNLNVEHSIDMQGHIIFGYSHLRRYLNHLLP